eukprot:GILJ01004890.1.p1 GENE.GILJ01004890.1~~GILJ01004890.1.p1  ORF type:complete len:150 (-),score=18.05 GILJ01004890.1:257-706(-)
MEGTSFGLLVVYFGGMVFALFLSFRLWKYCIKRKEQKLLVALLQSPRVTERKLSSLEADLGDHADERSRLASPQNGRPEMSLEVDEWPSESSSVGRLSTPKFITEREKEYVLLPAPETSMTSTTISSPEDRRKRGTLADILPARKPTRG